MDLKVSLEDERLCTGCPMNGQRQKCEAGHVRLTGVAFEYDVNYGFGHREKALGFQAVRPTSCLLAEERANKAISALPGEPSAMDQEWAKAKGICTKCRNKHKNYEPCAFPRTGRSR